MAEPLITIRNLVKDYPTPAGPLNVLRGIDLDIHRGDFIAVLGPSGAGKTTFLNMLTAIDAPTAGQVTIEDRQLAQEKEHRLTKWRARNIGIVFQFFQLLPTLTVAENVVFPMDFANVYHLDERHQVALRLLRRLGIEDQAEKTPDMLSGGQQQRAAIARALATNPPLIIGDEPTANLDRMSAENVFSIFQELADQGHTVIISTYDRAIVKNIPIVLELDEGVFRETAMVRDLKQRINGQQAAPPAEALDIAK
jgi:putative ABC transport system ATP-binding protein